jgi:hypothetical protein
MSHDQFEDSPIDLSALERDLVTPVMARVRSLPAYDASQIGPLWGLWSMSRRLTIAVAMAVLIVLALLRPWQNLTPRAPQTVAESIGVPPEFQELLARQGAR